MPKQNFTLVQISFILLLSVGLLNHVIIIPVLLDVSRRDAWLSVVLSAALFIPVFAVIGFIIQRVGTDRSLLNWLGQRYGRWLSVLVGAIVSINLFLSAYVTGRDMTNWINASFLPQTPPVVIIFTFIGLTYYLANRGIRTIAYSSAILLPIVVLLGEFVMTFNFSRKDYTLLLPPFEFGMMPMWQGVLYVGTGLVEVTYLLFMHQHLTRKVKKRSVVVLGWLMAVLTIGPVMGALAEFGPVEGSLLRFPAFEEWRIVKIGNYIEHVDFLSIFQWMSGAFVRIGLALYLLFDIVAFRYKWIGGALAGLLAICISIRVSDIVFLNYLRTIYFPVVFYSLMGLLLLLFVLALIAPRNGGRSSNAAR